jgi:hypothetical protein
VKASEKLNRFMLMAGKHDAVARKYGVSGYPTFIFIGPDGKKVGDASRDAGTLIKQIDETAGKWNRAPKWAESEEAAAAQAKESSKPLVIFFRDDKPKSEMAANEFGDKGLSELYEKAAWVVKTLEVKSDEAKALGITALPAVWIVDPRVDDAKARILKKSSPKASTLKSDLAGVLKSWKKDAAPVEASKEEPKEEPKDEEKKD